MFKFAPPPLSTDGEASHPGPRLRRRGPRSEEATARRLSRNIERNFQTRAAANIKNGQIISVKSQDPNSANLSRLKPSNDPGIAAIDLQLKPLEPPKKRHKIENRKLPKPVFKEEMLSEGTLTTSKLHRRRSDKPWSVATKEGAKV